MWPGVQNIIHNLLWEILLRVFLLVIVCIFQLKVSPRMNDITEAELVAHYMRPRHESYVTPLQIVVITVIVPLLFIYLVFITTKNYVDTIQAMLAWTLAASVTAVLTESLKLMVGRPRPDFFYRCYPNGTITPGLVCTSNTRDVIEGRKSFPSGHTSFSFCSLGFLSIWMCGKLKLMSQRRRCNWRVLVCFSPLIGAAGVGLSRYYDNHHHWEDIIAGSILGLASSYFSYRQYYHAIGSHRSGEPLTTMTECELYHSFQMECCTRSLNEDLCRILQLSNKNSCESNKICN